MNGTKKDIQVDLIRERSGEERSRTVLEVDRGETCRIIQVCDNYANGEWYYGWPLLHLPIACDTYDTEDDDDECIGVLPFLPANVAVTITDRMADLVNRIVVGHTSHWDGDNHVGRLSPSATDAARELIKCVAEQISDSNVTPNDYEAYESWGIRQMSRDENGAEFTIRDIAIDDAWLCLYWRDCGGVQNDECNISERVSHLDDMGEIEVVFEGLPVDTGMHDASDACWAFCMKPDLELIKTTIAARFPADD